MYLTLNDASTDVNMRGRMEAMTVPTHPEMLAEALGDCCAPGGQPLPDEQAEQIARVFKALGDPTRIKLYSLIAASTSGEMCVCDLTGPVGLSQPTVSHHMKILVEAGLATREQRGRWAYYKPAPEPLHAAATALTRTSQEPALSRAPSHARG